MFNKKLLLLQNVLQTDQTARSTFFSPSSGEVLTGELNISNVFTLGAFGRLDLHSALANTVNLTLVSTGTIQGQVLGQSALGVDILLTAAGRLELGGAASFSKTFTLDAFGSRYLHSPIANNVEILLAADGDTSATAFGQSALLLNTLLTATGRLDLGGRIGYTNTFTLNSDGTILGSQNGATALNLSTILNAQGSLSLRGGTTLSIPVTLDVNGSKYLNAATDTSLTFSLLNNGSKYIGGSTTLIADIGLSSSAIMDLAGAINLSNNYILTADSSGTLLGAFDANIIIGLLASGSLSSEIVSKIINFELSIQQLKELDLAIKQLYT